MLVCVPAAVLLTLILDRPVKAVATAPVTTIWSDDVPPEIPPLKSKPNFEPAPTTRLVMFRVPIDPGPLAPGLIDAALAPVAAARTTLPAPLMPVVFPYRAPAALTDVLTLTVPLLSKEPVTDNAPALTLVPPE